MPSSINRTTPSTLFYCLLAGLFMAYGWGYRGTVGHEAGAMVPAALLGLVICLGSGRSDWYQRSAVTGLFAAGGWCWGGSISYMEHTFYTRSDSFPNVLYGYSCLFLIGAMWAGIGMAILGLGLSESRSELEKLARPFFALATVFFLSWIYFFFNPDHKEAFEIFTVRYFHDGDWFPATLTLIVGILYWFARPQDRSGTTLFIGAALSWWIGYGILTQLFGLRLGPLHRSESWSGVLGILIFIIVYLKKRNNRAALMMTAYGIVGGGLGYAFAVFVFQLNAIKWGPLANILIPLSPWRTGEITIGFFMGITAALAALRLIQGGLAPAKDDTPRMPLDILAVFTILVALPWMNFRCHFARTLKQSLPTDQNAFLGLSTGLWYIIIGLLCTLPLIYALYRYRKGDKFLFPAHAFGKGATIVVLLTGLTVTAQFFDLQFARTSLVSNLCFWLPSTLGVLFLIRCSAHAELATTPEQAGTIEASSPQWNLGKKFNLCCCFVPIGILALTGAGLKIQDGNSGRLRFGPDAYWQQTARIQGTWTAIHQAVKLDSPEFSTDNLPIQQLEFDVYRNVTATLASGELSQSHKWAQKDQYNWIFWHPRDPAHPEHAEIPIRFKGQQLYIAWPPKAKNEGYIVFERIDE